MAFENNIYVFGGYDGVNRKNDFYKYNVETNTWMQLYASVNNNNSVGGPAPLIAAGIPLGASQSGVSSSHASGIPS